ncbi:MAG: alpha/beta fold hydrolase [Isosphaeraceae bacterium]|jgi:competence protein ComEC
MSLQKVEKRSHADQDHYNALPDLLDRFQFGELVIPPGFENEQNPEASLLLDQLRTRGIPVRTIAAPLRWDQGGARFTGLHPPVHWRPEAPDNARSLVLDAEYEGRHLLLTGDLDQLGLSELVSGPQPEPPIELMFSPHHGGKSANPSWLYSWARPRTVVVSQRPPAPGTTDALTPLERAGTPLLRTWQRGAIHIRWTPDGIVTQGFLDFNGSRALPAWPAGEGASSRHVFAMLLSSPWVLHDAAGRMVIGLAGFLLGIIACALLAIVEYGAWALVVPPRPRLATEALSEGECETASDPLDRPRPISALTDDGVKLAGTWHPAARGDTGRTTLLLHGFAEAPGAAQAQRVAALRQGGWNVAALDLRGYGRSSGTFASFGGREAGDVRDWLDTLAAQPGQARPLLPVLWGRSMGAAIAVRAAAEDPRIQALVLESPMVDLDLAMAAWFRNRGFPCAHLLARLVTRRARGLAGVSLTRPRPLEVAPRVHCPVLIVHGSDDTLVTSREARRLAAAFPNPPGFVEVSGAGHADVVTIGGDALLERILQFLREAAVAVGN